MLFAILVAVSSLQLLFQEIVAGGEIEWLRAVAGNAVASAPWLPLALGIVRLTQARPPDCAKHFVLHGVASIVVAALFLLWLAGFHVLVTPSSPERTYLYWLRRNVGEFSSVVLIVYWSVVAAALVRSRVARAPHEPTGSATDSALLPLVCRSVGRSHVVDPRTLEWVEAEGDYARLHTEERSFLIRCSMAELADRLAPAGFVRIHRSVVVRLDRIVEVRPRSHGDAVVTLADGRELKVSRTYRESLGRLGR